MGSGKGGPATHGSLEAAEAGLQRLGAPILRGAMEQGAIAVGAAAFPQFAGLLYGGYAAYRGFQKIRGIMKEYNDMTGSPQERVIRVGLIEGVKTLVGEGLSKQFDKPVNDSIERAVHTTVNSFNQAGVFDEIAKRVGLPRNAEDLEYFFATAAQQSLAGAYGEAKSQVAKYVAEGVVG